MKVKNYRYELVLRLNTLTSTRKFPEIVTS